MDVITMENEAFKKLIDSVNELKEIVQKNNDEQNPSGVQFQNKAWLNKKEACRMLRISERTLQTYRNNGIIPYSRIQGKIYYKLEDIKAFFDDHYQKSVRQ